MSRPCLNFACEDSRLLPIVDSQGTILPGIYEVARVELPENKSYWLRYIGEVFANNPGYGIQTDTSPFPFGPGVAFWDLRVDRIETNRSRPPFLIGAPTGIQGNPVSGFPRRDHVIDGGGYWGTGLADLSMEIRGPAMLRLFCEILPGAAATLDLTSWVGGRLVVFTE